ncbi:AIPR family protein [Streptomyces sp. NPDC090022]|uniref:AIPR family protein n=1 Tax=Streptomyces sp. NPDC090022 TaxID=3365920 RepID=UPI003809211B
MKRPDVTRPDHDAPTPAPSGTEPDPRVRFVRDALTEEFGGLVEMGDAPVDGPDARQILFLSRALAAKAVRLVTGCTAAEAADSVIDGRDDHGIDAVAFSLTSPDIWLIQSKWSNGGNARLRTQDVHRLVAGLRHLAELQYDRFNHRFQRLADRVDEVLASPHCRIHLVAAVMGDGHLSAQAESQLYREVADFNFVDARVVDVRLLGIADFHSAARYASAPRPLSVTATLSDGWYATSLPYRAYVGTVAADELALWYQRHGERLYEGNLRQSLGLTKVNQGLVSSLTKDPQDFWYFNNGITVLCDAVRVDYFARRAEGQPARLELSGARVANGAQTLTSVFRAYEEAPDAAAQARVLLRVICVEDAPGALAAHITLATNTQNHMEARDFIALDDQQAQIRDEFARELGKEYVYKRGALGPAPAAGCSVVEAATALACAHPDSSLVARLHGDSEFLWRRAPAGAYTQLFSPGPPARQIWRSVLLLRAVSQAMHEMSDSLPPRARAVCDSGRLLVAHIVFQTVGLDGIDEPDGDWESRLDSALERSGQVLSLLIALVDRLYGPHIFLASMFTDELKCRELTQAVLRALASQADAVELAAGAPRRPRRPNSVKLLVEHGRIPDGARLVYRPATAPEEAEVGTWLSSDPARFLATWVNDARRPLVWEADGKRYSPSGLVVHIWAEAGWRTAPVAVQGTSRWILPGEGSLDELARAVLGDGPAGDGTDAA